MRFDSELTKRIWESANVVDSNEMDNCFLFYVGDLTEYEYAILTRGGREVSAEFYEDQEEAYAEWNYMKGNDD